MKNDLQNMFAINGLLIFNFLLIVEKVHLANYNKYKYVIDILNVIVD